MVNRSLASWLAAAALLAGVEAQAVTLDFPLNDLPSGFDYQPSVSVASGGLEITVSPYGHPDGAVDVHTTGGPGESELMGTRSVNPSRDPDSYGRVPARFDFSLPVVAIDLAYYDQGGDDDGDVILAAYSDSQGLVSTFAESYGTSFGGNSGLLSFPDGIDYLVASTTGSNAHSLGWSIRRVTAVPEPAAGILVALALAPVATRSRRRRRLQAATHG